MKELLNGILAKHSGQELDKLQHDSDRDYFMNAVEAKEYGLVDELLQKSADYLDLT